MRMAQAVGEMVGTSPGVTAARFLCVRLAGTYGTGVIATSSKYADPMLVLPL